MCNILAINPETFRDWQYSRHQQAEESEPLVCDICGNAIEFGEEIELHRNKYSCPECVADEMRENEMDYKEAIISLTELSKKYSK